jgi:hypothetical protein
MPGNNRSNQLSNSALPGGKVGGSNGTTNNIHVQNGGHLTLNTNPAPLA